MLGQQEARLPKRHDDRLIIHFDYDCFYAAVFEAENPALKSLPLAVQQKQIIVTCNYEARRRGLHKLQLIKEAKKACPDLIIVLGEDLTRFRNASKDLYSFLRAFVWNQKAERLGFDEVFLDVTDLVDYNVKILNHNSLPDSFFHLDRADPTMGFAYDASSYAGCTFPAKHLANSATQSLSPPVATKDILTAEAINLLGLRLRLGSHLAWHIRLQLEEQRGFTSTVGISTNKLLSKLVGNINKPTNQTTLVPPYLPIQDGGESNVVRFMDPHDVGKVPGIGFKLSQKIRGHVLGREAKFHDGLVYGGTKENVTVQYVRLHSNMSPKVLDRILQGPGSYKGIGERIWALLHGVDDTDVGQARDIPRQISIEDSYIRLDTLHEVEKELRMLAGSLIRRMRIDLTEIDESDSIYGHEKGIEGLAAELPRRWRAHPRVLRLSTRPRPGPRSDATRTRTFNRISRSGPMPMFVFTLSESIEFLVEKLVTEALLPLFRKLHPDASGWDLSLVNVAATNMMETAGEDRYAGGRDIGRMFKTQDDILKEWKVEDVDVAPAPDNDTQQDALENEAYMTNYISDHFEDFRLAGGSEDHIAHTQTTLDSDGAWNSDDEEAAYGNTCKVCGATVPAFAMAAHEWYHTKSD